jgi:hypothetical protein
VLGSIPATAPLILACRSSILVFAGKAGKYTLFLTNAQKEKSIRMNAEDRGAHVFGRNLTPLHSHVIVFGFYSSLVNKHIYVRVYITSKFVKRLLKHPCARLFHSETDFHANQCWVGSAAGVVLFNDGVSSSDCTESNGRMINKL